jgi:pimeloyl-ACP methyl ester carboxylesterase
MPIVNANGIEIEVEEYGSRADPAILLIMGLAAQLTLWPKPMIDGLVSAGFRVIRFDNRDIGLSQKFHEKRAPSPALTMTAIRMLGLKSVAPYTLHDMAVDAVGVLDALDIPSAHVVGVSMGGMIGQLVAAKFPTRTRSFTAIMSSTNNRRLPQADPALLRQLFGARTRPRTHDELIDRIVALWNAIGTPDGGNDPAEFREKIAASVARCNYPSGVRRQIAAIVATGDLRPWTRKIAAPTLVIHGSLDPLAPPAGGRDIAANVKGARIEIIDGMGHDLPPKHVNRITELIADHARSAESQTAQTRAA